MGQLPAPVPDLITRTLERGERYLFCTDGISRLMSDREIASILGREETPATSWAGSSPWLSGAAARTTRAECWFSWTKPSHRLG